MTNAAQLAQYGANNVGLSFKNRLINGDMSISQRNGTSSVSITGGNSVSYTLDRWLAVGLGSGGVFSVQQVAEAPAGFINSIKATVTTAQATVSASYTIQQRIEGLNVNDFGWGTANAQAVTLSFWVRSSLTGTFGGSFTNSDFNRTYPFPYTISAANTWEYKTITIPGDTTGTWLTTNGIGIELNFGLGAEVAREATANVWANTVARQPTGTVDLISTNGATWQITGVQLEKGTVATSFDYLPYGTELMLCQRYCQVFRTSVDGSGIGAGRFYSSTAARGVFSLLVTMRTAPSVSYNSASNFAFGSIAALGSISSTVNTTDFVKYDGTVASSSSSAGFASMLEFSGTSGVITASAEL